MKIKEYELKEIYSFSLEAEKETIEVHKIF